MTIEEITAYILSNFKNVNITEANGDLFFLYADEKMMPFATIVTSDNDFDHVSQLNREGFYRLNIGIDKISFTNTFEGLVLKKGIGAYVDSGIDFTAENVVMPHPIYGAMYWLCIVNPNKNNIPVLKNYLDIAYGLAVKRLK